jgi:hypothetical protein
MAVSRGSRAGKKREAEIRYRSLVEKKRRWSVCEFASRNPTEYWRNRGCGRHCFSGTSLKFTLETRMIQSNVLNRIYLAIPEVKTSTTISHSDSTVSSFGNADWSEESILGRGLASCVPGF